MNTSALPLAVGLSARLMNIGIAIMRYGFVAILLLIGGLKYTQAEAMAIQPLIAYLSAVKAR